MKSIRDGSILTNSKGLIIKIMTISNKRRTLVALAISALSFVCHGGPKTSDYANPYTSDGLIKGSDILTGLLLIAGGALLIFLFSRTDTADKSESSLGCLIGAIGPILVVVGLIFLIPLFELLGDIFLSIIMLLAIPVFIFYLVKRNK